MPASNLPVYTSEPSWLNNLSVTGFCVSTLKKSPAGLGYNVTPLSDAGPGRSVQSNTFCVMLVDPGHPPELPQTVYVVDTEGLTAMLEVVEPLFQVYDCAPMALSTTGFPAQETEFVVLTYIDGCMPGATAYVPLAGQPPRLPATEYTVGVLTMTCMLFACSPVLHV